MKATFFIIALLILFSINGYVILRGWQALAPAHAYRSTFVISMLLLFVALMTGLVFPNNMPLGVAQAISFIGFSYLVIFTYLFLSFLAVDIIRIFNYYIHFFTKETMATFRMGFLVATLAITFVAMIIGNYQFNHPKVVSLQLSVENPRQHKQIRIVAVTDLHVGINIGKKILNKYVQLINNQHPDLVLLPGDLTDRSVQPVIDQNMNEEFGAIKAPLGVFAVNGNHEHYAESPTASSDYIQKSGIVYLHDEARLVDNSFYVVGREDRSNRHRKKLLEIVRGLDEDKPKILLDHQPSHFDAARQNGIDLQISGHTHNGQFFPGNLFVKRIFECGYGYYKRGKTHYYVSSGLGLWGPQYRIGTQSEIVVITLKY
ncbi:MAG TPA: metallophosphoesterase [Paludibacter sp.]|nr:metallophosphoesterase [Paludibacter sp.]